MATGGGAPPEESGLLSSGDEVSGKLLSYVASRLYPEKQEPFALQALGLKPNDLSYIQVDFPDSSRRRNYQILNAWYENTSLDMTVGPFLDKLVAWQQAGYFSRNIWSDLVTVVSPELIPGRPATPGPSSGEQRHKSKPDVSGAVIGRVARNMTARNMTTLAVLYLGEELTDLRSVKESCHGDLDEYKREILKRWVHKNLDHTRQKLEAILTEAARRDSLLDIRNASCVCE